MYQFEPRQKSYKLIELAPGNSPISKLSNVAHHSLRIFQNKGSIFSFSLRGRKSFARPPFFLESAALTTSRDFC